MGTAKPKFHAQVWNRYHGAWQDVKESLHTLDQAKTWFFENPDKRRVLEDGMIVLQPRD